MVTNLICVPSTGTDKTKFLRINEFDSKIGPKMVKVVASGFRNAGKISVFIQSHCLAYYDYASNWNGYGYSDHTRYYLMRRSDAKVAVDILQTKAAPRKAQTEQQKTEAWCRRLVRLTNISMDDARRIAQEKKEDQTNRIVELEARQSTKRYSVRRQKLIEKLSRSNPLRRIVDTDHAFAILHASIRHNKSDYESCLEEAKELAAFGQLDYSEIKAYARQHATFWGDITDFWVEADDQ